jgi:MoxR-like ATPase
MAGGRRMKFDNLLNQYIFPLRDSIESVIVGQRHVINRVVMALFAVGQRDFYPDGSRFLGTGHVLCEGGTGTGKCLAKGTPVLMFDGSIKNVEDVKVGDLLMGPDSKSRKVISLGHGFDEMYDVSPVKGESYVVNSEHILSLKITPKYKGEQRKIVNISVKDYLNSNKTFKHRAKTYRVGVDFDKKKVPLDSYFLGVWLGDGISRHPEVCNTDDAIIKYCAKVASDYRLRFVEKKYKNKCPNYALSTNKGSSNSILNKLRSLNILMNKHVPNIYKFNTREVRLQVLAGMMDTDGHFTCNGYDCVLKNKRLAEDLVFIARSLGFAAYIKPCEKTCVNNGVKGQYYRFFISGDTSIIPVKIKRKKASKRKQKKDVLVSGIKVTSVGKGEYFGFEISGPDRLFLLGDFTVTHNTVLCKLLARLLAGNNKRVSGMPDALASDITGCEIILLTGNTKTVQGPLFCNVLLADEINRFPPKAQNAFIEALAEGSVTIANETYKLAQPFFCLATQNPTEQKGTSRIQEALADRFMFKLVMRETTEDEKIEIAKRTHNFDLSGMKSIVNNVLVCESREQLFDKVYVSDETRRYCARLIHSINHPEDLGMFKDEREVIGTDPLFKQKPAMNDRSMLHLEGAAMMEAIMQQRDYVTPYDVVAVAADVFRVRLIVADSALHLLLSSLPGKYQSETQLVDNLINQALNKVGL